MYLNYSHICVLVLILVFNFSLVSFLIFLQAPCWQVPALKKAQKAAVDNLPCRTFTTEAGVTRECYICLDVYEQGDSLRRCVYV